MENIEHMENRRTWNILASWIAFEVNTGEHRAHREQENMEY